VGYLGWQIGNPSPSDCSGNAGADNWRADNTGSRTIAQARRDDLPGRAEGANPP